MPIAGELIKADDQYEFGRYTLGFYLMLGGVVINLTALYAYFWENSSIAPWLAALGLLFSAGGIRLDEELMERSLLDMRRKRL